MSIDAAEVLALVRERVAAVLALDGEVDPDARFDEDLHADSLDLVEVIEGVEQRLTERGHRVDLSDDELAELATVRDAAHRIAAAVDA